MNLGGGHVVPYPEPTDAAASKIGKANRRTETKPEVRLRSTLHRKGLGFRKDYLVRAGQVRVHADIVFTRRRVVVFVDGCFWHGCPEHQRIPKSNRGYWMPKLAGNVLRDRRVDDALRNDGWAVIRIWEHIPVAEAAAIVEEALNGGVVAQG